MLEASKKGYMEPGLSYEEVMALSLRGLQEHVALIRDQGNRKWRFGNDEDGRLVKFDRDGHVEYVPDYPNDLMAAWELVEEMRRGADGHFTLFAFTTNWRAAPGTIADLLEFSNMAEGETAAIAITRAYITANQGVQNGDTKTKAGRR